MHILFLQWTYYNQHISQGSVYLEDRVMVQSNYSDLIMNSWSTAGLRTSHTTTTSRKSWWVSRHPSNFSYWLYLVSLFFNKHLHSHSSVSTCRLETHLLQEKWSMYQSYQNNHHLYDDPLIGSNLRINHQWHMPQIFNSWEYVSFY